MEREKVIYPYLGKFLSCNKAVLRVSDRQVCAVEIRRSDKRLLIVAIDQGSCRLYKYLMSWGSWINSVRSLFHV